MIKFAPSVLSADFSRLGEHAREAVQAGAGLLHFDVMDGHFVPNITFGPLVVRAVRNHESLPFEVHLMISEPERAVEDFVRAGADRILVHPEVCPHLNRVLHQIQDAGAAPGVALNPSTPLESIEWVLDIVECILVMTVNPGFGGQEFIPLMLQKIRRTADLVRSTGREIEIGVDGGINTQTAPLVADAGANVLIAGSSVFGGTGSVQENLRALMDSVAGAAVKGG